MLIHVVAILSTKVWNINIKHCEIYHYPLY